MTAERRDSSFTRVIVEKPFGHDLASARALNAEIAQILSEKQTYRIDHYLGKETVQNILIFRFGNAIFEHLWDRKYIDHVEIVASETIAVDGRAQFYDSAGVIRDIVQNHLLQVLALCAMEPPNRWDADSIRNEKVKVLQALQRVSGRAVYDQVRCGQYEGYLEAEGVAPRSRTPTFVDMTVYLDNWRWAGVPFELRAGKALDRRLTEVAIHYRSVPMGLFSDETACERVPPNVLRLRLQPNEGIELSFGSKLPGEALRVATVDMDFTYEEAFGERGADAYERLILDAMRGDQTLFARRDEVEEAWRFVTPILEALESKEAPLPKTYARGSAGPVS